MITTARKAELRRRARACSYQRAVELEGVCTLEQARKHKAFKDTAYALEKIMPPVTDEEARYHHLLVAQMTCAYIDTLEKPAKAGRIIQQGRIAGARSTSTAAAARTEEIRRVYSQIKAENPDVPRYWYIEQTVKHFQGARKHPRQYYGERTVKTATRGL